MGYLRFAQRELLERHWYEFRDAADECSEGPEPTGDSLIFRMPVFEYATDEGVYRFGGERAFGSAREYIKSGCWRLVRGIWHQRYEEANQVPTQCFVCCKMTLIELHHLRYAPLGLDGDWDVLDQVIPLCTWHHHEVEKRIRRGIWPRATAHLRFVGERGLERSPRSIPKGRG